MMAESDSSGSAGGTGDVDSLSVHRHPVEAVGILVVVAAFIITSGPMGALVSLVIAGIWYLAGVPFAIGSAAIGYVAVAPPSGVSIVLAGGIAAGLFVASVASVRGSASVIRAVGVLGASIVVLALLVIGTYRVTGSLLLGAVVLVLTVGIGIYGVHRVAVVDLDRTAGVGTVSVAFGVGSARSAPDRTPDSGEAMEESQ